MEQALLIFLIDKNGKCCNHSAAHTKDKIREKKELKYGCTEPESTCSKRLTTQRVFQLCLLGRYSGRKTIEWGDCSPVRAASAVYSVIVSHIYASYYPVENNR